MIRKTLFILAFLWCIPTINSYATTYAIIVGVEQYDGTVSNLSAAVDDAERMYAFFSELTHAENIIFLSDKDATKQKILYAMETLFAKANPEDLVFFYFSGHGDRGMFCPHNVNSGKLGLWHTEIKSVFKQCKARTKICIADACFAGSIKTGATKTSQTATHQKTDDNVMIFMSSRDTEISLESRYELAGYFTKYFILGMKGFADSNSDDFVDAYELYTYVRKNVRADSHGEQTPVMFGNFQKHVNLIKYK